MIHALLAMFGCASSASSTRNASVGACARSRENCGARELAFCTARCCAAQDASHTASRTGIGIAPCRNSHDRRPTSVPCQSSAMSWPPAAFALPKVPRLHHSTPWSAQMRASSSMFAGETASTRRSCASLIHTSVGDRPSYLVGARSRCTVAPSSPAISPIALEKPPAPQSVRPL